MKEADEKTKKINLDSIIYFIIFFRLVHGNY